MEILFVHLLISPLLLVIFYIIKAKPPKKINNYYGYRTAASMRSQETWDFANEYSVDWMIKMMWILLLGVQIPSVIFLGGEIGIMVSIGIMLIFLIIPIIITEKRLQQMFNENGEWKEEFV